MPRKVKTITEEEQVINDPVTVEPVNVEGVEVERVEPVDEDLESFMNTYAEDEPQIKIYKYNSFGKAEYCNEVSSQMATEQYIQHEWGAGKYRVRLYKEGKYLASKNIWIGKPADFKEDPVANPAAVPGSSDIMMQMILSELNANREIMRAMIEKMGNGNKPTSFIELAQAMEMLKTVITPPAPQSPTSVISEMVGILKQGIEIGSSGGSTDKGGWMGVVRDVAQAIPQVIASMPGRSAQPAEAPGSVGAPNPVPVPITEGTVPMPLRLAIQYLKIKAQNNSDPNVYIAVALDNLDDPRWAALMELVDRPYEEVANYLDPDLLKPLYRPFFETLLKGLQDAIHDRGTPAGGSDLDEPHAPKDEGFSA